MSFGRILPRMSRFSKSSRCPAHNIQALHSSCSHTVNRINKQPLNFDDFVNFVGGSRDTFSFLDVETRDTIVVPSDEEGRGGTVSLSATMTLKRKSDGHVFLVQVNEIFEITWFQLDKGQGKRFITKVFGVILSPISVDPFLASA